MHQAVLTINLSNIKHNWFQLKSLSQKAECAAVVKANAYGLGAIEVVKTLKESGCKTFFVAYIKEALEIKPQAINSDIYILNGVSENDIKLCKNQGITPVINSLNNLKEIDNFTKKNNHKLNIALHFDTGINRLGMNIEYIDKVKDILSNNKKLSLKLVMSHLASADEIKSKQNEEQLNEFKKIKQSFTNFNNVKFSLANSSGVFLGEDYHFDILRPGYAIYGGNPTPQNKNPMLDVVKLNAKIISLKNLNKGDSIGYNASWTANKKSKIATISYGYSDGFLRSNSNTSKLYIKDYEINVVGKISMDLTTLDVSHIPDDVLNNNPITIIGKQITIDDLAKQNKTIGYEILTSLGPRLKRNYINE